MAKATQGFLAEDGTFFVSEREADMHTAEMKIRAFCVSHTPPIDPDKFIEITEALADTVKDYLDAKDRDETEEFEPTSQEGSGIVGGINRDTLPAWTKYNHVSGTEIEDNQDDDQSGKAEPDAVLQFSIDGYEPVPDLGGSAQSESVLIERKSDGPRSRKRDA